ncbi:hypothetical protein QQ045_018992 [Rhodiola kirilowii]
MNLFRRVVSDCALVDFGYLGYKFTYTNKRKGASECKSRLDRVLVTRSWLRSFPEATNNHLYTYSSDHMALLLDLSSRKRRSSSVFRFENMWLRDCSFKKVVEKTWLEGSHRNLRYEEKLGFLQQKLTSWNRHHFGNVHWKVKNLKDELAVISQEERSDSTQEKEELLRAKLDDWLQREEILWKQRSRIAWLEEGDNNSTSMLLPVQEEKATL